MKKFYPVNVFKRYLIFFLFYVTELNLNCDHCPRDCYVRFSDERYDCRTTITCTVTIKVDTQMVNILHRFKS